MDISSIASQLAKARKGCKEKPSPRKAEASRNNLAKARAKWSAMPESDRKRPVVQNT